MTSESKTMCTQCGERPSMFEYEGGHNLCVDCNAKVMAAERARVSILVDAANQNAAMLNYLTREAEAVVGLPGLHPQIEIPGPAPILQTGPVNLNNFNIDNSVIGAINTGTIQQLDVDLTEIAVGGNQDLATAMQNFTAVALDPETPIDDDERQHIVEEMTFVADEVKRPPEQRKAGMARMVMQRLKETATTVTALSVAWNQLEPLLERVFG